ncbi:hypothetical protein CO613_03535 [Lysobacteraceae bacterium NML07-0707]|nr:hypothetical protein CO613_03535 [Xanthomonadaceae bacterium NML07-0707]
MFPIGLVWGLTSLFFMVEVKGEPELSIMGFQWEWGLSPLIQLFRICITRQFTGIVILRLVLFP